MCRTIIDAAAGAGLRVEPQPDRPATRTVFVMVTAVGALLAVGVPSVLYVSAPWADTPVALTRAAAPVGRRAADNGPAMPSDSAQHQAQDLRRAGDAAYGRGGFDEAFSRYDEAVAASPDVALTRNNLAQVLVRQGRPAEALVELDAAIERDPDQWSFRFNRARVYGLLDRWPEAVAEYRVALGLFPDDYVTHFNLALAQLKVEQFADAAANLERVIALVPEQHDFLITLGTAYIGAGQRASARAAFERFLEAAPSASDAPRVRALLASMDSNDQ
jgi:tetratricopeptide (TPR) repeat protein